MSDPAASDRLNTTTLPNATGSTPDGARQTQQSAEPSQSRRPRQAPNVQTSSDAAPVEGAATDSSANQTATQRGYANASGHVDPSLAASQDGQEHPSSPRITMASPHGDYSQTEFDRRQASGTQYVRPAQRQPLSNQQTQGYDPRQHPGQGAWNQPAGMYGQGQFAGHKSSAKKPARTWQGIKLSVIGALSALALLCGLVGGLAGGLIAGAVSDGQSQMSGQSGMPQMGGGGYGQLNGQSGSGNSGSGSSESGNSGGSDSGTSSNDSSSSAQSDLNGTV